MALKAALVMAEPPRRPRTVRYGIESRLAASKALLSAAPTKPTGAAMMAAGRGPRSSRISSRWNSAVGALPMSTTAPARRGRQSSTAAAERVVARSFVSSAMFAFMAQYQIHQKLFYALEEMGQLPAMHRKVFSAIHQQNKRLSSESEIIAFATASGMDGAKLAESMKSFGVSTKVNRAKQLAEAYKIDGVPALGINGRFYTSATLAGTHERAVAVADFLIQLSRTKA